MSHLVRQFKKILAARILLRVGIGAQGDACREGRRGASSREKRRVEEGREAVQGRRRGASRREEGQLKLLIFQYIIDYAMHRR